TSFGPSLHTLSHASPLLRPHRTSHRPSPWPCVAAGRGFFHINSHGGAEPCPFSPYSDTNVRDKSLREALHSELFRKLQENGTLLEDHAGGCVLFEKRQEVEVYLNHRTMPSRIPLCGRNLQRGILLSLSPSF
ncbi:MAG: hypothetical protein KBS81_07785, partial [Spirochaetales bacterium]|nr:hypothetical protein [Candidatus Physcosoma equi]